MVKNVFNYKITINSPITKKQTINKMMNKKYFNSILASTIFLLLISSSFVGLSQNLPDFTKIVKDEQSKVVHISTTTTQKIDKSNPFFDIFPNLPDNRESQALGSGFFYSDDGYIVTNNHVIKDASKIEVLINDNEIFPATLIGSDERTDLALLKIDAKKKFSAVKWGDSNKVQVGEWVLAIGNPLGLDQTVTAGIISAKDRDVLGGTAYGSFLQTDAAINFGNSGGPLLNLKGEVIGINTAIAGGQGLGFAIPSNLAQDIIKQLLNKGKVTRGWLGVSIQELTPEIAESLTDIATQQGVLLVQIYPDSPAATAGLEAQDIIIAVNNKKVTKNTELQQIIAETTPGNTVNIRIIRNKKELVKRVKIIEFKEEFVSNISAPQKTVLGLEVVTVNKAIKDQYNLSVDIGVLVLSISPNSVFSQKISAGDVILKVNNNNVKDTEGLIAEIDKIQEKASFVLLINRNGTQLVVPGKK